MERAREVVVYSAKGCIVSSGSVVGEALAIVVVEPHMLEDYSWNECLEGRWRREEGMWKGGYVERRECGEEEWRDERGIQMEKKLGSIET